MNLLKKGRKEECMKGNKHNNNGTLTVHWERTAEGKKERKRWRKK